MKKFFAMLMALVMALSRVACGGSDAPVEDTSKDDTAQEEVQDTAASSEELIFTTGGSSGTYYGFGSVLAGQISGATDSKVTAVEGAGSQGNIELMDMEGAQLGFVQSDVAYYAMNGIRFEQYEGAPITSFKALAALYMEQVQIVTCDPSIKTVADLAGKNVSIGASGSGVYYNAIDILGVYGLTEEDINPTYQGFGDSAEALKDGKIDAAFVVAGAPTTAITELASGKDVYLVSLDAEHIAALLEVSPYYSESIIAADVYGLDSDTTTVAVGAVVIARDDVAEGDVYNFVSGIYENVDAITSAHAKGAELSLDFAASVTSVPYHPGAAKYFAEKGLTVPTK